MAENLYIVAIESVEGDETIISLEADGEMVYCLYAVVKVTPKRAVIVDNCYRSAAEAKAAWPDAVSPEITTIESARAREALIGN
jgi:hypothetical protein